LNAIDDFEARVDRLVELNIVEQVRLLRESPIVLSAPVRPTVHGWVFGLRQGLLTPLTDLDDLPDSASTAIAAA